MVTLQRSEAYDARCRNGETLFQRVSEEYEPATVGAPSFPYCDRDQSLERPHAAFDTQQGR